ncbi:MAG: hypothetical protein P4L79_09490 [Legionella sp.]|uniref:hypothetical protein n=1 Tax=Legionella sp. TaxID=459 RepID=UPI00284C020D|nr:hypothetical protein [Legionella sp.]
MLGICAHLLIRTVNEDEGEMFWWGILLPLLMFGPFVLVFFACCVLVWRSYVRVTKDEVEYFDGWKTKLVIKRSLIVSVKVVAMGIKIDCLNDKKGLYFPLAFSHITDLLVLLKQQ